MSRKLLIAPTVPWSDLRQTPQQLSLKFAEHGWTVYYGERGPRRSWNVEQVAPQTDIWRIGRFTDYARRLAQRGGVDLKIVGDPSLVPDSFWEVPAKQTLFLLWDSFDAWKPHEEIARKRSTVVAATSRSIAEPRGIQHVIRNAVSCSMIDQGRGPRPYLYQKLLTCSPILYFGYIGEWVDVGLLDHIGNTHTLVFAGRVKKGLRLPENAINVGQLRHEQLRPYIEWAGCTLIPFRECETARCASPLKMYESLACGTPVVSLGVDEAEEFHQPGVITAVKSRDQAEVVSAINDSLHNRYDSREKCVEFAKKNTWEHRYQQICEITGIEA